MAVPAPQTPLTPYLTDMMDVLTSVLALCDTYHDFGKGYRGAQRQEGLEDMEFYKNPALLDYILRTVFSRSTPGLTVPSSMSAKEYLLRYVLNNPTKTSGLFEPMVYNHLMNTYPNILPNPEATTIQLADVMTGRAAVPTTQTCKLVFGRGKPPKGDSDAAMNKRKQIARFIHAFLYPDMSPDTVVYYTFDAGSPLVVESVQGLTNVRGLVMPQNIADSGNTMTSQLGAESNLHYFGEQEMPVFSNVYTKSRGYNIVYRNLGYDENSSSRFAYVIQTPTGETVIDYSDDRERAGEKRHNGYSNGPPVDHLIGCIQYLWQLGQGGSTVPVPPPAKIRDFMPIFSRLNLSADSPIRSEQVQRPVGPGDLFLDVKRGGDWDQITGALYAATTLGPVIFCTEDLLCATAAWLMGAPCIFSNNTGLYLFKRRTTLLSAPMTPEQKEETLARQANQNYGPKIERLLSAEFKAKLGMTADAFKQLIGSGAGTSSLVDTLRGIAIRELTSMSAALSAILASIPTVTTQTERDTTYYLNVLHAVRGGPGGGNFAGTVDGELQSVLANRGFTTTAIPPAILEQLRLSYILSRIYEELAERINGTTAFLDMLVEQSRFSFIEQGSNTSLKPTLIRENFVSSFQLDAPVYSVIDAAIKTLKSGFPVPVSRGDVAVKYIDPLEVLDRQLLAHVRTMKQLLYAPASIAAVDAMMDERVYTPALRARYREFLTEKTAKDAVKARDISLDMIVGIQALLTAADGSATATATATATGSVQRGGDKPSTALFVKGDGYFVPSSDVATAFLDICSVIGDYVSQTVSNYAPWRSIEQLFKKCMDGRIEPRRRDGYVTSLRSALKAQGVRDADTLTPEEIGRNIPGAVATEMGRLAAAPTANPYLNELLARLMDDDTVTTIFADMAAKWSVTIWLAPPAVRTDRTISLITTLLNPYTDDGSLKAGHPLAQRQIQKAAGSDPVNAAIVMFALMNEYFQGKIGLQSSVVAFLTKNPTALPVVPREAWTWEKIGNLMYNTTPYILWNFPFEQSFVAMSRGGRRRHSGHLSRSMSKRRGHGLRRGRRTVRKR